MVEAEYDRLFDTLARMAADLDIPPDEAEQLIADVFLSTLVNHHIYDMDTWVTAAFTAAAKQRGRQTS